MMNIFERRNVMNSVALLKTHQSNHMYSDLCCLVSQPSSAQVTFNKRLEDNI